MTTQRIGFRIRTVYKVRKPRVLTIVRQKLSFLVASVSLFAFVMGNMVGQHGWYAFWKTVLGAEDDSLITFVGTVPPIAKIPDYQVWSQYGGNKKLHTYSQVPQDVLRDIPSYDTASITGNSHTLAKQVYSTMWAGGYSTTNGSHAGVDIDAPRGTPIVSIANGVIEKVSLQTSGFGHHVLIRHPNVPDTASPGGFTTLYSTYAHMDAVLVSEGMVVHKGQLIGTVGNTGLVFGTTGYHLYFSVETVDAPYHPYWPFTSGEIASAGMSFVKAVDSTVYQERLFRYTLNPMLFVKKYQTYVKPTMTQLTNGTQKVVFRASLAANISGSERLKLFSSERARKRMASAGFTGITSSSSSRIVVAESVTEVVKTASVEDSAVPSGGTNTDVDHLTIQHSGKLSRTWQKVTISAVDRNGDAVKSPSFGGRLYVIPEFGDATVRPLELGPLDFSNGVATVNVLSRSNKTLFISTRGAFTTVSAPMIMER